MKPQVEKKFEALAAEVCSKACSIRCRPADFVEGLELLIDWLNSLKTAIKDNLH